MKASSAQRKCFFAMILISLCLLFGVINIIKEKAVSRLSYIAFFNHWRTQWKKSKQKHSNHALVQFDLKQSALRWSIKALTSKKVRWKMKVNGRIWNLDFGNALKSSFFDHSDLGGKDIWALKIHRTSIF